MVKSEFVCLSDLEKMAGRSCILLPAVVLAISAILLVQVASVRLAGSAEASLRIKQRTLDRCPYLRGGDGKLARPLRIVCAPLWLRLKGGRRDDDEYGSDEDERSYGSREDENEERSSRSRSSSRDASIRNNKDDGDDDFEKISGEDDDNVEDDQEERDEQMTDEADKIPAVIKDDKQKDLKQQQKEGDSDEDITDVPDEEIDEGFFKGLQTGQSLFAKKQGQGSGGQKEEDDEMQEDEDDEEEEEEEERRVVSSVEDIAGEFEEMDEIKAAAAARRDGDDDRDESEGEKLESLDKLGDFGRLGRMGSGEEEDSDDEEGAGGEMLIPMPGMEASDDNESLSSTSSSFNFSDISSEQASEERVNKSAGRGRDRLDLRKGPLGYVRGKVREEEKPEEMPSKSLAE
jgi:hypothetical protein